MKNLKYYLDTRRSSEDTPAPIKLRYTKNRSAAFITTDVKVKKNQWDPDQEMVAASSNLVIPTKKSGIPHEIPDFFFMSGGGSYPTSS